MKIRRLVTAFLALLLVLSGLSFACPSAKAEGDWSNGGLSYFFAGGVLTISASPDVPDGKNWMHDFDSESRPPWEAKYGRDAIKTIRITNGVRNIGEYAFTGYKNLTTVVMDADSVTAVGPDAFKGCKKLKTVQFSENLETICSFAFDRCAKLTSVTLPVSLQRIEDAAFAHCGLTSVNVPEGTAVKTWDFFYPRDTYSLFLYHISLPANVRNVYNGAFAYNPLPYDTPECILPQGTTVISAETFAGAGVRYVWLSEDSTRIGSGAFAGSNLQFIYIPWGCQEFGDNALPEGTAVLSYGPSDQLKEYVRTHGLRLLELEDPEAGNG